MGFLRQYRFLSTRELTDACVKGDPLAWSAFIARFAPLAERAIRKRLDGHRSSYTKEDIDDIKQGFFLKLWNDKALIHVTGHPAINHWICMIAANYATDCFRKMKRDALTNTDAVFNKLVNDAYGDCVKRWVKSLIHSTDTEIDRIIMKIDFEAVCRRLTTKENMAIKFAVYGEMKHGEIARLLRLSPGTVSSLISRAREKIKKIMQENV